MRLKKHFFLPHFFIIAPFIFLGMWMAPFVSYGKEKESASSVTVQAEGLTYEYKSEIVKHPSTNQVMFTAGRISVVNNEKKVVYEESTSLQPGVCDEYPTSSKLSFKVPTSRMLGGKPDKERSLVVFCGSVSGRHQTLKVFSMGPTGLRTASIDFENTRPNLKDSGGNGMYEAAVYRRLLFDDLGYQSASYLFIYELLADSSIFGFAPTYGGMVAKRYLDYYKFLFKTLNSENFPSYVGPLLAMLMATKDSGVICRELAVLQGRGLSNADLEGWEKRLVSAGYPGFDFKVCRGR